MEKPLARLVKKREREITQISKIRNERGETITDITDIKKKLKREYYEKLYANRLET